MIYGFSQYSWTYNKTQTTRPTTGPHYLELFWDALTAKCAKVWKALTSCVGSQEPTRLLSGSNVELLHPLVSGPETEILEEQAVQVQVEAPIAQSSKSPTEVVREFSASPELRNLQQRLDSSHVDYKRFDGLPPGSLILTRQPRTSPDFAYLQDQQYLFRSKYFFFDEDGIQNDLDFSLDEDVQKLIAYQQAGGRIQVSGNQLYLY